MTEFLKDFLQLRSKELNSTYLVRNHFSYKILQKRLHEIPLTNVDDGSARVEDLNSVIKAALIQQDEPVYPDIFTYNNVYTEAKAIRKHFQGLVATENVKLKITLDAIDGAYRDGTTLELNLWVKTGEAIFLKDKVSHIYACCNHPWTLNWFKVNLFHKNHLFRNKVINLFTIKGIDPKKRHRFADLVNIHHQFILSITNQEIINIFADYPDCMVNVYEYLGIINSRFLEKLSETSNQETKVINQELITWTEEPLWVGGLSANQPMDKIFLRGKKNLVGLSGHVFENGEQVYPDPGFSHVKVMDKVELLSSSKYIYTPPCPERHKRKTSFAINHITKLLNNPLNFYVENILKLKSNNFHPNHIMGITTHAVFEELIKTNNNFNDFPALLNSLKELLNKNYFSKIDKILIENKSERMLKNIYELLEGADELYAEHEGVQKILYNGNEYMLHGRADLIYKQADHYGVIDFKTGNPPAWINVVNGLAPQIPMAMLMLRFGGFLGEPKKKFTKSGFISPKGFLKVDQDLFILQLAINGITKLIQAFWEESRPYYFHLSDVNSPYRIVARRPAC